MRRVFCCYAFLGFVVILVVFFSANTNPFFLLVSLGILSGGGLFVVL